MDLSVPRIKRLFEKCHNIAVDSPDENTKVGAALIHKNTRSSVAEGFNGHIRKGRKDLSVSGQEKYRVMVHSEMNLIANAFRTGAIKYDPSQYVLFCTISPCEDCDRFLHQCGINEIWVQKLHKSFDTYKVGTDHKSPAPDIEGHAYACWEACGGYASEKLGNLLGKPDIFMYKIYIKPKEKYDSLQSQI